MIRLPLISLAILTLAIAGTLSAAPKPPDPRPTVREAQEAPHQMSEFDQKLIVVRQLLQQNNYEGATAILESLMEADPYNPVVSNLLKACYLQLKRFGNLEMLTRRLMARDSNNISLRLDLADALANQGKTDDARRVYQQTIQTITEFDQTKYGAIVRNMLSHDLDADVLRIIDSLRQQFKKPNLFALERGSVLERQKKYDAAAREYFRLLPLDSTGDGLEAARRVAAMLDFYESSAPVEQFLSDTLRAVSEAHAVKLLTDFYIKSGHFDKAYSFAIIRDSLEKTNGSYLNYYVQQCYERMHYQEVVRMASFIFTHRRANAFMGNTPFVYANALARLGRFTEACAVYDTIFASSPREQEKGDALFQIGMIYYDLAKDYPRALKYFDSVTPNFRRGLSFFGAQKMTAYCYLKSGNLDAARKNFEFIRSQPMPAEDVEEIAFNLAMICFYEKNFDSAQVGLRKLLVDFPQGYFINDAVQTLMVFDQAEKDTSLLSIYAGALWCEQRGLLDSCRVWLERLANADNKSLADIAQYRSVLIDFRLNDTVSAMAGIERLITDFADSYYTAFGLKLKADLYAEKIDKREDAKTLYKQILEKYPNYPFASEVRKKLRQLETSSKVG